MSDEWTVAIRGSMEAVGALLNVSMGKRSRQIVGEEEGRGEIQKESDAKEIRSNRRKAYGSHLLRQFSERQKYKLTPCDAEGNGIYPCVQINGQ